LQLMIAMIDAFCLANADSPPVAEFIAPLQAMAIQWQQLTSTVAQRASTDADEIGAAAYDYLFYSGYVALAYWWARAVAAADVSSHSERFKATKLDTARFYFARILPRTSMHKAAIESGAASLMAMPADRFDA
jgi:hypothetical protein